ncbi:MAG: hypothetical protein ILP17_00115, partial [Lachnospiraceae bacterium]|nr:hypothetical protein [Lachnospiraceae bacterium]
MESISCLQWDIMYPTWMPSDAIRSWDTMMQFCNYIQNGHATLSVFGLQHWVILLCNKHAEYYYERGNIYLDLAQNKTNEAEEIYNSIDLSNYSS